MLQESANDAVLCNQPFAASPRHVGSASLIDISENDNGV